MCNSFCGHLFSLLILEHHSNDEGLMKPKQLPLFKPSSKDTALKRLERRMAALEQELWLLRGVYNDLRSEPKRGAVSKLVQMEFIG